MSVTERPAGQNGASGQPSPDPVTPAPATAATEAALGPPATADSGTAGQRLQGPAEPTAGSASVEAGWWLLLAAAGLTGTALLARTGLALGVDEPPWPRGWDLRLDPLAAVPLAVAAVVIALTAWWASAIGRGRSVSAAARFRLPWAVLLLLGFVGTLAWSIALALVSPGDLGAGLRAPADLVAAARAAGDDPLGVLASYTGGEQRVPAGSAGVLATHPPGPVLLVWLLARAGLTSALGVGLVFTVLGALCVPVVCAAVRSLCHETAARRLVPVLVLAPWGGWLAGCPDAVTALLAALAVAVGVVGCEPGRRSVWWALGSGLLLGLAALFGYASVWLGVAIAAAYFVRRRPLLNVLTGLGALVPLWLAFGWGFSWPDGLALARAPEMTLRAALAWVFLDLTVVVLATGPVAARAVRRLRLTPGWPFLLGAVTAALFALAAGLADGGVERSWLPLFPWLLVAAVAPQPRPAGPDDRLRAGGLPVILMSLGAVAAVALRLCLGGPGGS